MAFTLNRRLAQLIDSSGQLNTGKIPNDYITSDHVADNSITTAMLHTGFTLPTSSLTSIDTDNVTEGSSNLYFTNARADARIAAADTDDLSEGSTNLYFTNARVDTEIDSYLSGGTGVTYSSGAISIGQDVGTSATPTFGNITTTGYLAGPATFTIDPAAVGDNTGTVVIAGNLQVDGTTTTINSTTVNVDDLNIQLATGAANAAAADGAGITVDGASATITYDGTNDEWDFNKPINLTGDGHDLLINSADYELLLLGNRGSTGVNLDKAYLRMKAEGTTRVVIDTAGNSYFNGGNVGIGTASPSQLLEISGATAPAIRLNDTTYNQYAEISTANAGSLILKADVGNGGTGSTYIGFEVDGASEAMRIDSSGNVGIGTDNPSRPLHISSSDNALLKVDSSDGNQASIAFAQSNTDKWYVGVDLSAAGAEDFFIYDANATTNRLLIDNSGNVGIGTNNPGSILDINANAPIITIESGSAQDSKILFVEDGTAAVSLFYEGSAGSGTANNFHIRSELSGSETNLFTVGLDGNVGIKQAGPAALLHIGDLTNSLGTTAGNQLSILTLQSDTANTDSLLFTTERLANGTTWTTAAHRIQRKVDTSLMGYMQFGSQATDGDLITFGKNANEYMRIDSAGNVGIGTDSPGEKLHVLTTGNTVAKYETSLTSDLAIELKNSQGSMFFGLGGGEEFAVGTTSNLNGTGNLFAIEQDGNVGIGTTSASNALDITRPSGTKTAIRLLQTGYESWEFGIPASDTALTFANSGSEKLRIDSSGALGLGTTPPSGTHTGWSQLFIGEKGSVISENANSGGLYGTWLTDNLYLKSSTGAFANITTDESSAYRQEAGVHQWFTQASGSADAAVTLSEKMRIDADGNVGIGTSNPVSAGSGTKSLHVSAVGEARLVLSGDNNNSGDAGQLDAAIYMLTDGGTGTDPFGNTSSASVGAHGYSFRVHNHSGDNTFTMVEEASTSANNLIHMNTNGDVVIGFGSTSVAAGAKFQVDSTNSMVIPKGTTAQRPGSAVSGALRFNTTTSSGEFYDGSGWKAIGYGSYAAEWLVVAGGGSGGDCTSPARHAGGGGAGGLRTSFGSTSGGGASAEANMTVNSGTVYTITVGAGGASIGNSHNTAGNSGSNSSIAGTGMTTITSLGGGGGGGNEVDGSSGGSGGGGKESSGAGQSGTAGQGYAGGTGSESADRGGGGGGAGAVGGTTDGGAGLAVSITGSSVTYAGGGASSGTGGAGGGGNHSSAGTANTGGGGGSAGSISGAGGSGVVILRMATSDYSGVTTGSPTVTTTGTDTVIKFTSSGTYTG